jgi:RNA polymerase sigma-70 factor (ECF subfamily)
MRELFQKFLSGDDAAFAELYREFNPRLSAYCYKLAPTEWEDIMQELWERMIAMRSKLGAPRSEIASPLAFLFQMLRNLSVDHFRRSVETAELTEESAMADEGETRAASDIECLILEAFEKLSFEDREVLVLNIYSGYKFGEIAEIQGKSVDAVWARASRARTRLREIVIADAGRLGISLPRTYQAPMKKGLIKV